MSNCLDEGGSRGMRLLGTYKGVCVYWKWLWFSEGTFIPPRTIVVCPKHRELEQILEHEYAHYTFYRDVWSKIPFGKTIYGLYGNWIVSLALVLGSILLLHGAWRLVPAVPIIINLIDEIRAYLKSRDIIGLFAYMAFQASLALWAIGLVLIISKLAGMGMMA